MSGGAKCLVCKAVGALVIIGAINWGLVGGLQIDVVERLLGYMTPAARAVYVLIGVAGLLAVAALFKCCPCQKDGSCGGKK